MLHGIVRFGQIVDPNRQREQTSRLDLRSLALSLLYFARHERLGGRYTEIFLLARDLS